MGFVDRILGVEKRYQEQLALDKAMMDQRIAEAEKQMLEVSEKRAIEKAREFTDKFIEELAKAEDDKKKRKEDDLEPKSYMYDPFQLMESLGYKERIMSLSYDTLRLMSERNPVVAAIINTRIHQVTAFSRPPKSKYDIGFDIVMRDDEAEPTPEDTKKMKDISNMLEATGIPGLVEEEERDSFEHFLSKETRDSLTYDQACFEIVPGRGGKPVCFYAVDGATIRYATTPRILRTVMGYGTQTMQDMWKREMLHQQEVSKTGQPRQELGEHRQPAPEEVRYVQVISGKVMNTYSEQEMAFGIRNPRTAIQHNAYGVSELEILISTITSHLWAEEYNKRFFSTGSSPKGIIHFEGTNIDQGQLNAFRRQWHAQVSGVWNAWKTPVIGSPGKLNYTNLQMTNRQMEFSNWIEYLIKLICAIYLIDPAEINFDLKGGAGQQNPLFESSSEQKLKFSKDRGLSPLLRFLEAEINKNIIYQIDPKFEFQWVGLDAKSEKEIQELRIKELERFKQIDEVRAEYDMDPIGNDLGGDLIMDSSYIQWRTQKEQAAQMAQQGGMGGPESMDFGQEEPGEGEGNPEEGEPGEEEPTREDLDAHTKTLDRMKRAKGNKTRGEGDVGELDDMISGLGKSIKEVKQLTLQKSFEDIEIRKELKEIKEMLKKK